MHTWEYWQAGKIEQAQEMEEDNGDVVLGLQTDLRVLEQMEKKNGEVNSFQSVLKQLLKADSPSTTPAQPAQQLLRGLETSNGF